MDWAECAQLALIIDLQLLLAARIRAGYIELHIFEKSGKARVVRGLHQDDMAPNVPSWCPCAMTRSRTPPQNAPKEKATLSAPLQSSWAAAAARAAGDPLRHERACSSHGGRDSPPWPEPCFVRPVTEDLRCTTRISPLETFALSLNALARNV